MPEPALRRLPAALFVVIPGLLVLPSLLPGKFLFGVDVIGGFYHLRGIVGRALAEGRLPVWDSHTMCGAPLLASMHGGVLYPLTWPAAVLSPGLFWTLTVWIHLTLAGLFAFAWLGRGLGLGRWPSLAGALLFMLSGFLTSHVYYGHIPHVSTFPWAAAVLWRLERFLAGPTPRRGLLLAVVLALMILAGFPQFVFILAFAVLGRLAHFVFAEREERRARAKTAAQAAGWLALAGLIAAPQLLPTLELIGLGQRAAGGNYEFVTSYSLAPSQLLTLVAPTALGDNREIPVDSAGFVGIAGLVLAALGAMGRSRQRRLWAGLGLLGLLLALGHHTPLFRGFFHLVPGVRLFRVPARYLMLFTLAAAPLAAIGFERLWNGDRRKIAAALGVFLVAELAGYHSRYFVARPLEDMEWPAEFVENVRNHPRAPFRIATVTAAQTPAIGKCQLAGLDHVGGYDPMMLRRYTELCNVARGKPSTDPIVAMVLAVPTPLFELLGARYWIVPGPKQEPPGWRAVGELPSGIVYENPRALPRAFLVGRSVNTSSDEERLRFMVSPEFDPRRVVVTERESGGLQDGGETEKSVVRLASREPGGYALVTESPADAFLVLAEAYYPGWMVEVDGAPAELLRANHLMQAVRLTAGRHDVRFSYHPRFLMPGFALAALGLFVPLGVMALRKKKA
ncbi:MAG: YfhO family protein [Planctomycetes bacterium]|nr:YfhO family protein [Planctomycetota bacterium]